MAQMVQLVARLLMAKGFQWGNLASIKIIRRKITNIFTTVLLFKCVLSCSMTDLSLKPFLRNATHEREMSGKRGIYPVSLLHSRTGEYFQLSNLCVWSYSHADKSKLLRSACTPRGSAVLSAASPVLWINISCYVFFVIHYYKSRHSQILISTWNMMIQ